MPPLVKQKQISSQLRCSDSTTEGIAPGMKADINGIDYDRRYRAVPAGRQPVRPRRVGPLMPSDSAWPDRPFKRYR